MYPLNRIPDTSTKVRLAKIRARIREKKCKVIHNADPKAVMRRVRAAQARGEGKLSEITLKDELTLASLAEEGNH